MKHRLTIDKEVVFRACMIMIYLLVFLYPLSSKGIVYSRLGSQALLALFIISVISLMINEMDFRNFRVVSLTIVFLGVCTIYTLMISNNADFSIGRMIYILIAFILFSTVFKIRLGIDFALASIDLISACILFGCVLSWVDFGGFNKFIVNHYTQYLDYITQYQLQLHKPILFFGVHNFAAFIYEGMFLLSYSVYEKSKVKRYGLYTIVYMVLLILLRCTTSIGFFLLSTIVYIMNNKLSVKKKAFMWIFVALFVAVAIKIGIVESMVGILQKQWNGFAPRYTLAEDGVFSNNREILAERIMHLGYCIEDGVYSADSGFLVNYTVGGVVYVVLFYYSLRRFVLNNAKTRMRYIYLVFILLMELGFITFMYVKTIAFVLMFIAISKEIENAPIEELKTKRKW